jgi:hypothetical protein
MYSLEEHHIFGGSRRKSSERYGLKVKLCEKHHRSSPDGVHFNAALMDLLHQLGQKKFKEQYPNENFIQIFGKNYL